MYLEIERKYLVSGFSTEGLRFKKMKQAYLAKEGCTLRQARAAKAEGISRIVFAFLVKPMDWF